MANTDVKKLLLKLGLDAKDYKAVWSGILKEADAARDKEKEASQQSLSRMQQQVDKLKESLTAYKALTSELQKSIASSDKRLQTEKAITSELSKQKLLIGRDASGRFVSKGKSLSQFGGYIPGGPSGGLLAASEELSAGKSGLEEYSKSLDGVAAAGGRAGTSLRGGTYAARGFLNMLGLRGGYILPRFLAGIEGINKALMMAFPIFGALAMIEILGQIPKELEKVIGSVTGWDEAEQQRYQHSLELNRQMIETSTKRKESEAELQTIGLEGTRKWAAELQVLIDKERLVAEEAKNFGKASVSALSNAREETKKWYQTLGLVVGPIPGGPQLLEFLKNRALKNQKSPEADADQEAEAKANAEWIALNVERIKKEKEIAAESAASDRGFAKARLEDAKKVSDAEISYREQAIQHAMSLGQLLIATERDQLVEIENEKYTKQQAFFEKQRALAIAETKATGKDNRAELDKLHSDEEAEAISHTSKLAEIQSSANQKQRAKDIEAFKAQYEIDEKQINAVLKAQEDAFQEELASFKRLSDMKADINQKFYKEGAIDAEEFHNRKMKQIEDELAAEVKLAQIRWAALPPELRNSEVGQLQLKAAIDNATQGATRSRQNTSFDTEASMRREMEQTHQMIPSDRSPISGGLGFLFRDMMFKKNDPYFKNTNDASDATKKFTDALGGAISALASLVQSLGGSKRLAGTLSSGQAGFSAVSGGISTFNSLFPSAAVAGPVGAAVSVAGGVISAILGHFTAATQRLADSMERSAQVIQQSIEGQGVTSRQGLAQLQQVRQQAIDQLSGRKGGRQSLDQLLPQLDAQIRAIQTSQLEVTKTITSQIAVLNGPMGYQDQISSLETILKQYRDYYNQVSDVNQAYQWLSLTLQKYLNDQGAQLAQEQQTAVQDALQLNDLLYQKSQLLRQNAQQEWDILTQGVLVRRTTAAQNKLNQLDLLKQEQERQLQDMNAQIQIQSYKVSQESQIFSIATNRIDLENQLVSAQTTVISYDMQRIAALKDVIAQVKSLGLGGAVMSYDQVASMFANIYNNFAQKGLSGFIGETS